jgi:hypothetical protein
MTRVDIMWWRTWIAGAFVIVAGSAGADEPPTTRSVARFPLATEPRVAIVVEGSVGALPDLGSSEQPRFGRALALLQTNPYRAMLAERMSEISRRRGDPRLESPYAELLNAVAADDGRVGSLENPYSEQLRLMNPYRAITRGTE